LNKNIPQATVLEFESKLVIMAALHSRCGHLFLPCGFFYLSSFFLLFFPRLISAVAEWMSTMLLHMMWPYCEFRMQSEMCCTLLAGNTGRKNDAKSAIWAPSHNFVGLNLRN